MKKIALSLMVTALAIVMLTSLVNATPVAQIIVSQPIINPSSNQTLTATVTQRGVGIIFVIQPATSSLSWLEYLNQHPDLKAVWNSLPENIKNQVSDDLNGFIASYKIVNFNDNSGGSSMLSFPQDFTGLNGQPSTSMQGEYNVVFAYLSRDNCCFRFKISFDCGQWFVVPESVLGTAMAIIAPAATFGIFATYKKRFAN